MNKKINALCVLVGLKYLETAPMNTFVFLDEKNITNTPNIRDVHSAEISKPKFQT